MQNNCERFALIVKCNVNNPYSMLNSTLLLKMFLINKRTCEACASGQSLPGWCADSLRSMPSSELWVCVTII